MKKSAAIFMICFISILLSGSLFANDWEKVRIGVEGAYPPFSSITPAGELVGFDIDITRALCIQMQTDCSLVKQDWDGILPSLLSKKYDAIVASLSITTDRKKKVAFTNPYYYTLVRFVRQKGSNIEITKDSMKGKVVGVQRATTWDNFITSNYQDTVEIKRYSSQNDAYLDAIAGRVDLLLANVIAISDGFLKTEKGKNFEFVGPAYSDPKYFGEGVGIAIRKGDQKLVQKFNQALAVIIENGTYQKINEKYFSFSLLK